MTDRKVFQFLKAKCESAFFSKGKHQQIKLIVSLEKKVQKGTVRRIGKGKNAMCKLETTITAASLHDTMANRNQKLNFIKLERLNEG
jgi:large subunit ribosomal protein L24e